jgi:hypothetical protein
MSVAMAAAGKPSRGPRTGVGVPESSFENRHGLERGSRVAAIDAFAQIPKHLQGAIHERLALGACLGMGHHGFARPGRQNIRLLEPAPADGLFRIGEGRLGDLDGLRHIVLSRSVASRKHDQGGLGLPAGSRAAGVTDARCRGRGPWGRRCRSSAGLRAATGLVAEITNAASARIPGIRTIVAGGASTVTGISATP